VAKWVVISFLRNFYFFHHDSSLCSSACVIVLIRLKFCLNSDNDHGNTKFPCSIWLTLSYSPVLTMLLPGCLVSLLSSTLRSVAILSLWEESCVLGFVQSVTWALPWRKWEIKYTGFAITSRTSLILFTWDDCITFSGCSEIFLTEDTLIAV
jgi:hypothetical protein